MRKKVPYMRARLWSYLAKHPGTSSRAVAEAFGYLPRSVSQALCRMRDIGQTRSEGHTHTCVWFAIGRKPVCATGLHPHSLANLQKSPEEARRLIRLALKAKGIDPDSVRPKPKPRNPRQHFTGALERYWPVK